MKRKMFFSFLIAGCTTVSFAQVQEQTETTATVTTEAPIPAHLKGLTTETLKPSHIFPVLGTYQVSGAYEGQVEVVLDETNKGIVWVNGLPQGNFKAVMKKSPATYKIPVQKSSSGKAVAEGTLHFNPETKELNIVLGRTFNDADPTAALTSETKKSKGQFYTGLKAEVEAVAPPASDQ